MRRNRAAFLRKATSYAMKAEKVYSAWQVAIMYMYANRSVDRKGWWEVRWWAYTPKHLAHSGNEDTCLFFGFLGRVSLLSSPNSMRRGVSSVPSESKACISSLKSMNSPAVAAVANLAGMEGIEPLKGARRESGWQCS